MKKKTLIIIGLILIAILSSYAFFNRDTIMDLFTNTTASTEEDIPIPVMRKPVIYLYPKKAQQIDVKINYKKDLDFSYPTYDNGWNIIAYPDGKIINLKDNKEYNYLFWEIIDGGLSYDLSKGFVIKGSKTIEFLQDTLAKLGLTPKEYNEFIVYWLPYMQKNEYNLIHFATKEEYNDKVILDIEPKPDSILRIFMVIKNLDTEIEIKPQELNSFTRNGFTVVEWGGTEVK